MIEFEQRIAAHDLESATQLYTGPFLDGVFLKNAPEFERWVDQERARLQHVQGDALERLAVRATAARRPRVCRALLASARELEPTDSRAARAVMESLVASGDPAGALAHYRAHQALLRDDLGLEPDATLAAFAKAVQHRKDRPGRSTRRRADETSPTRCALAEQQLARASSRVASPVTRGGGACCCRWRGGGRRGWCRSDMGREERTIRLWSAGAAGTRQPPPPHRDRVRSIRPGGFDARAGSTRYGARGAGKGSVAIRRDAGSVVQPGAVDWSRRGASWRCPTPSGSTRGKCERTRSSISVCRAPVKGYVITAEARSASTDSSLGVIAEAAAGAVDLPDAMLASAAHCASDSSRPARRCLPRSGA